MKYLRTFMTLATMASAMMNIGIFQQNTYAKCPCDIYADGKTPCVAAHSTVRALYSAYNGPLYQVKRTSDSKTLDIGLLTPGGYVNAMMQDTFLNGKAGTISKIYDQSAKANHLTKGPGSQAFPAACLEANATAAKIKINGYNAYGIYTTGAWEPNPGSGYRNNDCKGLAINNQPEGIYMVCSGKHYNSLCCFDYGNAQPDMLASGTAIMETVYFGNSMQWGWGAGSTGPWVMSDLEWGVYAGGVQAGVKQWDGNTAIIADYVTAIVKGDSTNLWSIRGGDAVSGKLKTMFCGPRPNGADYYPMKKKGAIVLGIGGDNSHTGEGTFFEGVITYGYPTDVTEDSVQANIIAAGYGKTTTSTTHPYAIEAVQTAMVKTSYNPLNRNAIISYTLQSYQHVNIAMYNQQGRLITKIVDSDLSAGHHEAIWDVKQVPAGVYVCRTTFDNRNESAGKIVVGK